ncbi:hypothetical protein ACFW2V_12420 [Streptomyces sp. NPDC058947]|uniref:hypothetical protein n=1 Tax=Streptomyces sp. NPDC058947 TaxID=3346675 RepID=UPI003693502A
MSDSRKELHTRHCPDVHCYSNGIDSPGAACQTFDGMLDRVAVRRPERNLQTDVAFRIRAELVCCNIYERVNDLKELTLESARKSRGWHERCYWGEASARIAEGRCPGYEAQPNICRCGCLGCEHNCSAHVDEGVA